MENDSDVVSSTWETEMTQDVGETGSFVSGEVPEMMVDTQTPTSGSAGEAEFFEPSHDGENNFGSVTETNLATGVELAPEPVILTSKGLGSEEEEVVKLKDLSDIYQNTIEIEMPYDPNSEALHDELEELVCYSEAARYVDWNEAMDKEIHSIQKNGTWELVDLPTSHKPIGLKWVYKLKKNTDGEIVKHKARLVAKGYVQKKGIDFEEVFAPVTRMDTARLLLALGANRGWEIHHLDVKSAFFAWRP